MPNAPPLGLTLPHHFQQLEAEITRRVEIAQLAAHNLAQTQQLHPLKVRWLTSSTEIKQAAAKSFRNRYDEGSNYYALRGKCQGAE